MTSEELKHFNQIEKKILKLRKAIADTTEAIRKFDVQIKNGKTKFYVEIKARDEQDYTVESYSVSELVGLNDVVRGLKNAVASSKGMLHHLEKELRNG